MRHVLCIAAGQLQPKKSNNEVNRRNRYLNYGLLSIASSLERAGYNPIVIHGNFDNPIVTFNQCAESGLTESEHPVLISIPSFYAVPWAKQFTQLVKQTYPSIKIIAGGRWVVGNRPDLLKQLLPSVDHIFGGLADVNLADLLQHFPDEPSKGHTKSDKRPALNHSLLKDRLLYQPSLEVSRGCGMGCEFCQEKDELLLPLKSPEDIILECDQTVIQDDLRSMSPYFQASMFVPNSNWIDSLKKQREAYNLSFLWRTEGRVDTIKPIHIKDLAEAGLKVLDLGLESASHRQLLRMKKTSNPEQYLNNASHLIDEAAHCGVHVKINVMLTAGETLHDIEETVQWLDARQKNITGVSVGPEIVFGWPEETSDYKQYLQTIGASINHSPVRGITHLNLSEEVNYAESIELSNEISRRFMTAADYFYLKAFSYFERGYTYDDFIKDVKNTEEELSFDISEIDETTNRFLQTA